jgi:hypothetical protein
MTKKHSALLALGTAMILTGCADYHAPGLDEPANNLPLSRPDPVYTPEPSKNPNGSEDPPQISYPPGTDYPINGPAN